MEYIILLKEAFASDAIITTILGFIFGCLASNSLDHGCMNSMKRDIVRYPNPLIDHMSKEYKEKYPDTIMHALNIHLWARKPLYSLLAAFICQIIVLFINLDEHRVIVSGLVFIGTFFIGKTLGDVIHYFNAIRKFDEEQEIKYEKIIVDALNRYDRLKNGSNDKTVVNHGDDFEDAVLRNKEVYKALRGIKNDKDLTLCDKYIIEYSGYAKRLGFDEAKPNATYIKVASTLLQEKGKKALMRELQVLPKKSKKVI